MNLLESTRHKLHDFIVDARAAITVELVLVLPLLIWAYFATMIFTDAYRARTQAQAAALHIADLISRRGDEVVTVAYFEGMNDVYDFLIADAETSRMRITAITWDRNADQPLVLWSYGTRGMNPLPDNAFQLMIDDDLASLREIMDGAEGDDLIAGFTQMPNPDLHTRIPPVMPGETLILVESFTMWESPLNAVFLGFNILEDTRLSPIAVTRPRFAPFLNFEGTDNPYPPDADEFVALDDDPDANGPADPVEPEPDTSVDVVDTDFSNGVNDGWSTTQTTDAVNSGSGAGRVGTYLGPFGRETRNNPITFTNTFSQTMELARYEFDLVLLNSWDGYDPYWGSPEGDAMMLSVNGEAIAFETFQVGARGMFGRDRDHVVHTAAGRVRVRFILQDSTINYDSNGWTDQLWRVVVRISDPAPSITIGFSVSLGQNFPDEGFGIAGMRLTTTAGAQNPDRWVPNAATRTGTDSLTGFAIHDDGCFVRRNPAPSLTLANSDLWGGAVRMTRNVGGHTRLLDCRNDGPGFFQASPMLVLDYTNDTRNWSNNRLRIRTDDYANGRNCDAVFLMRDQNNQWWYVDDLSGFGWNAGLELAHAQSGSYTIWAGRFGSGTCQTDIVFEHY